MPRRQALSIVCALRVAGLLARPVGRRYKGSAAITRPTEVGTRDGTDGIEVI